MRRIRSESGQSTAEYAVLFAIVIGAAVAVQQYVGGRIKGAIKTHADAYSEAADSTADSFEPEGRTTTADATTSMEMDTAKEGTVSIMSKSKSTIEKNN